MLLGLEDSAAGWWRQRQPRVAMLIVVTTHPIQYQIPIWQTLAADGRIPFEVWYITRHGVEVSPDQEFGTSFRWDIDALSGYPHQFLESTQGAVPWDFRKCRLDESLRDRLRRVGARAVWIQGWQVAAYWQAAWEAKAAGIELWLRGESNDLTPTPRWKRPLKRIVLGQLFSRVDRFLYIGSANKRLYRSFGIPESRLHPAPYAVDNQRFARQANALRPQRWELRRRWGIADDVFCVLFCGKFIEKKRPMDVVEAARLLRSEGRLPNIHLLFAGSGELGGALRHACTVVHDAERETRKLPWSEESFSARDGAPAASFAGFLNQTEISRAYVAADCLVLPSEHDETWGLVVNEALASGTPAIASTSCGCTEDLLPSTSGRRSFVAGDVRAIAGALLTVRGADACASGSMEVLAKYDFSKTVETVQNIYASVTARVGLH
jgi:glycosyltransferase involved in cell wall biosynthesis